MKANRIDSVELAHRAKAVLIPVSASKGVVIESHRPVGYDANLVKVQACFEEYF